eukprot:scaffold221488_cov18-Prasinocladus_malaysianus.AAC.1
MDERAEIPGRRDFLRESTAAGPQLPLEDVLARQMIAMDEIDNPELIKYALLTHAMLSQADTIATVK